ncbi:tetratricopeptide repeat-containing sensor histidine kinase [Spirosoma oryzicola]|uniref:tetratricopeptide repeat-containing sensor histidine kinase n=1 Tax=Spirosoma oryzicola TaxID=2898794 RepID=UPI001E5C89D8|nr:tetratricopeptide repeat protein [Spirosoma oryzicola]UHG94801.1 tetratricopeptide repeat protein [Spirosoma oryzicola]
MKLHLPSVGRLILILLTIGSATMAQQRKIDSLKTVLVHRLPDTTRANTYYDIANLFYKQNQSDSALSYLKRMQPVCLRAHYWIGLGDYNRLSGVILVHQGLFEDALTFYQKSLAEYSKVNASKAVATVYHNMGLLYKMIGQNQGVLAYSRQGLDYMQKAIALNERLGAVQSLRSNYINIGILYEDFGDYKLARNYFYKALSPIGQTEVTSEDARILYNNLGKNYTVEGQYQKAITYLEKALAINLAVRKVSSLIHNYRNLATAYNGLKQPDKAIQYTENALTLSKQSKDASLVSTVYATAATVYADAGQYDKAYASLVRNKRIDDSLMTIAKTRTISQLEGKYATQQAQALATIKANLELARTQTIARMEAQKANQIATIQSEEKRRVAQIRAMADIEKTRAVAELQTKYDTQKKVHRIAELDQYNQQRTRQIQYMTGGLGALLLLLSALVGQYTIIRRTNRRLSIQNEIITVNSQQLMSQSDQLRTLMKELHHRVKNNLAIVSSLLKLQSSRLDDEKAIQAVRVGQQRVEAMSLIHQRLYQTDQLTAVNMAEYLTDLAYSLMRAYGYQHDKFTLQLNVDLPELDVDVAIPLGLIVNELVTNAFKYAYSNNPCPLLRINLYRNKNNLNANMMLEVQDNGPGIDVREWQGANKSKSFGKRLIMSLSEQLDGQGEWLKQNGTLFRLSFQNTRLSAA